MLLVLIENWELLGRGLLEGLEWGSWLAWKGCVLLLSSKIKGLLILVILEGGITYWLRKSVGKGSWLVVLRGKLIVAHSWSVPLVVWDCESSWLIILPERIAEVGILCGILLEEVGIRSLIHEWWLFVQVYVWIYVLVVEWSKTLSLWSIERGCVPIVTKTHLDSRLLLGICRALSSLKSILKLVSSALKTIGSRSSSNCRSRLSSLSLQGKLLSELHASSQSYLVATSRTHGSSLTRQPSSGSPS